MTGSSWSIADAGGTVLLNAYYRRVWMRKIDETRVAGSNERIGDQRNLPQSLTTNFGSVRTTTALTATSAGAISINAHTVRYGGVSVSYSAVANAVTGKAVGSTWLLYCIDPDYSGGVQTWLAVTSASAVMNLGDGVVVAGAITIPSSGSSSGGGGGGGAEYCVDWDTVLPDGRLVRDLQVGDKVDCIDVTANNPYIYKHAVNAIAYGEEECLMLTTSDDVRVIQSKSTPMDLRDGRQVKTADVVGEQVLVYRTGELLWDTVIEAKNVGVRKVVKVDLGNRMFFAGVERQATIATHNLKVT
jgi:hypothetical protein